MTRAFGERILVKKIFEDATQGGISISKEKIYKNVVTVVSLGIEAPQELTVGDKLKLSQDSGVLQIIDEEEYLVIIKNNILGYV